MDSMATSQANMEATLTILIEAQQAIIAFVTSLTEKLDTFVSRHESDSARPASSRKLDRFIVSSIPGSHALRKHPIR